MYVSISLIILIALHFMIDKPNSSFRPSSSSSGQNSDIIVGSQESVSQSSDVKVQILKQGQGPEIKSGDKATVHYTGWLTNGVEFDSSLDRQQPFQFTLGSGQVIAGWEQGVLGMKVGEKRKLTIPPDLGYGQQAIGSIPAGSTLIFEVELLKIN